MGNEANIRDKGRFGFLSYRRSLPARGMHRLLETLHPVLGDRLFIRALYRLYMRRSVSLGNPVTFTERLQWLKLYYRHPEMVIMADKYLARGKVARDAGEEYLPELLGVWKTPDEIEFALLPHRFVLKAVNCGGGNGVVICRGKESLDAEEARKRLKAASGGNIARRYGEWHYRKEGMIIAEEFLGDEELADYKFFCFNGEPRMVKVDLGRWSGEHHSFYFDMEWNRLGMEDLEYPSFHIKEVPECPASFGEMKKLAGNLSSGWPFVRIDLYDVNGRVYFGEYTFFPASGLVPYYPESVDRMMGEWLELPRILSS